MVHFCPHSDATWLLSPACFWDGGLRCGSRSYSVPAILHGSEAPSRHILFPQTVSSTEKLRHWQFFLQWNCPWRSRDIGWRGRSNHFLCGLTTRTWIMSGRTIDSPPDRPDGHFSSTVFNSVILPAWCSLQRVWCVIPSTFCGPSAWWLLSAGASRGPSLGPESYSLILGMAPQPSVCPRLYPLSLSPVSNSSKLSYPKLSVWNCKGPSLAVMQYCDNTFNTIVVQRNCLILGWI